MSVKEVMSPVQTEARKSLDIHAGDTVRVTQKIQEKGKTRLQVFEGLVLAVKHGSEPGATFTVRKVASGVGVEKIFPLYSPMIEKIEIVKRTKMRRAKLYYIRKKAAKEIRRAMRNAFMLNRSTDTPPAEEVSTDKGTEEQNQQDEQSGSQDKQTPEEHTAQEQETTHSTSTEEDTKEKNDATEEKTTQ